MINEEIFLNKNNFATIIENMVRDEDITHFQAVIAFCEENNKDIETITQFMSQVLLDKVMQSARDMGLMPQEPSLEDYSSDTPISV
jgi:hypothetical protein